MKVYTVKGTTVSENIAVDLFPYPHVTLGAGGNKRATWVSLGKKDATTIVKKVMEPCPERNKLRKILVGDAYHTCEKCGVKFEYTDKSVKDWFEKEESPAQIHPDKGEVAVKIGIADVGIIALKDKDSGQPTGKCLIVAPKNGKDDRVLVFWAVSSGYRGSASISAEEGITVIAKDYSWHSGRGSLGATAEILAILKPGQELTASRSGRRVQENRARLRYDGKTISVIFGDDSLFSATADEEVAGDYL